MPQELDPTTGNVTRIISRGDFRRLEFLSSSTQGSPPPA
jgi:hypothetical protein